MNFMTFHILGTIIPTDELIFFRGVGKPPTRLYVIGFTTNQRVTNCCRTGFGELFHLWLGQEALGANCQSRRALRKKNADVGWCGAWVKQWGCHAAKILRLFGFVMRFQYVFNAVLYGLWWDYQWFIELVGAEALLVAGWVLATDIVYRIQIDIWRFGCWAILSLDAQRNAVNMQQFHSSNSGRFSGRM